MLPAAAGAAAQTGSMPDLGAASLEDLMKIQITSASRKQQPVEEVPAAIFVITRDDIRRSGMRTLPELLRLAPGVQVAQLSSSNWAVSIRGFNDQFSNKLLVLVDGRSIYKRVYSGVFWDAEDVVIDDIDRIEIIRGPGGAVWGANAVNGVINIVTSTARETQGALLRLSAGTFDRVQGLARYGGAAAGGHYRVYSQWTARGNTTRPAGADADAWDVFSGGGRFDWTSGANTWMLDGSVRAGDGRASWTLPASFEPTLTPRTDVPASFRTGYVLGRWTRQAAGGATLQIQLTGGLARRTDLITADENSVDADAQYRFTLGARHDIVTGGGYRFVRTTTGSHFAVVFEPAVVDTIVSSLFIQDEIAFGERLHVTLGAKLEHDTFAEWGLQPTARVMWAPHPDHRLWMAASRALRTPSLTDLTLRVNAVVLPGQGVPVVVGVLGAGDYQPETFDDLEAGYKVNLNQRATAFATVFRGRYRNLPTAEPLAPVFETQRGPPHVFLATRKANLLDARTSGFEAAVRVNLRASWTVSGSYSGFRITPALDASSADAAAGSFDANAPSHQWQLHSGLALGRRTDLDASLFHASALRSLAVPSYTRADLRVEVRLNAQVSVIGVGRNLTTRSHAEFRPGAIAATRVPRSGELQLMWRF